MIVRADSMTATAVQHRCEMVRQQILRVDLALDIIRHRAGRATLVLADDDGSIGDFREKKRPLRDIMPKYGRITA